MHFTAIGGLEGNRTDGALVKDITVFLLNVNRLSLKGLENHIAVKTSGGKRKHDSTFFVALYCML